MPVLSMSPVIKIVTYRVHDRNPGDRYLGPDQWLEAAEQENRIVVARMAGLAGFMLGAGANAAARHGRARTAILPLPTRPELMCIRSKKNNEQRAGIRSCSR